MDSFASISVALQPARVIAQSGAAAIAVIKGKLG
jgi:hypothetical protein